VIEQTITNWHAHLKGELPGGLDALLADDVVFLSPIVFTPQEGKDLTKMYLSAAGATFTGDEPNEFAADGPGDGTGSFRYVKEVMSGNTAVLEFESTVDGVLINGIDMITCDDEGKIVEFKVMLRPLKAINLMHAKMQAMIEQMSAG
jgi:hypothetical protein